LFAFNYFHHSFVCLLFGLRFLGCAAPLGPCVPLGD